MFYQHQIDLPGKGEFVVIRGANGSLVASRSLPATWYAVRAGSQCECRGYERWGHCGHGDAVRELEKRIRASQPKAS